MKARHLVLYLFAAIALSLPSMAKAGQSNACPIAKSIYRDAEGKGFQLVFGPPPEGSIYQATATIEHPQQAKLYQFLVTQSSGYGSIWLVDRDPDSANRKSSFSITFFDQDLKSANPLVFWQATESPQYAAIAGLGSIDYSQRRGTDGPPLLGDMMWIFQRCQVSGSDINEG